MLSNLSGWHTLIVGTVVLVPLVVIAVVMLLVRRSRNSPATAGPRGVADDATARLTRLTELRDRGLMSDSEYEEKRRDIVDGL